MHSRLAILALCLLFCVPARAQQRLFDLNSSNAAVQWKLTPQTAVTDSKAMMAPAYDAAKWVVARVPGATFVSYVQAGLEKDPNFGDNIYRVDKAKYDRDFWYRAQFRAPVANGRKIWLNFEGVNRKGEVYFNGAALGTLDGFMERGHFDVTDLIKPGAPNVLAVLVHWPGLPIPNRASPTYIPAASWDWMPYVPGLLSGITDDVYLTTSGALTLDDPWIRTLVPNLQTGEISLQTGISNHSQTRVAGVLSGVITPGNVRFSQAVTLGAGQTQTLNLSKAQLAQLAIRNPKLWWPNGYGAPNLYNCALQLSVNGAVSDFKNIRFGIKQYSYNTKGDVFHLFINGQPIFMKGGNWGMSEYLLRARGDEYDLKAKLHRDMNFNMIRNWTGAVTDEEFYDACDKYGLMVWDDFWLNSNPNLPEDVAAFNANAIEKIKRLRNHPSIAVWCGDNEGVPQPPLNENLRDAVKTFDGGDRWYQPRSNGGALSGSGPWVNRDAAWYFTPYPTTWGDIQSWGMRTEIGTAVFVNFESFKKFMPPENWWPRNEMWDKHFFGPSAANAGPDHYVETLDRSYGKSSGIEEFCRKAQLLNLQVNKAMFEGWQHNIGADASGILTWMSQSAYPSMVWQTYDYYYDLNGAYWGAKKACEPLHVQWNSGDNGVKVVNTSAQALKNARVQATIFGDDGRALAGFGATKTLANVPSSGAVKAFDLNFDPDNLAYKKTVFASSEESVGKEARAAVDGGMGSRWSSQYSDDQWIAIDLGALQTFSQVNLIWESAAGRAYKIQVSDDKTNWRDVYATDAGDGGTDEINFPATTARYVRMLGLKRATNFGYSLYEFGVYAGHTHAISPLHFIELKLTDATGKLLSDNFYWRSSKGDDYTDINKLPAAQLKVQSRTLFNKTGTKRIVQAQIASPQNVALAIRVTPLNARTGEPIAPVMMNDNYFSLMRGESKTVNVEFDASLLGKDKMRLRVEAYNR